MCLITAATCTVCWWEEGTRPEENPSLIQVYKNGTHKLRAKQKGKTMKYTTVKISEIAAHPTKRLDPGYWIKKKAPQKGKIMKSKVKQTSRGGWIFPDGISLPPAKFAKLMRGPSGKLQAPSDKRKKKI